jgi:hypothetical protein
MNNFWAIAVGINQYQHFQPLSYAQRDASMLYQFWVDDVGIAPDHCTLLTEVSPTVNPQAVYPNGANIRHAIAQVCQRIQPGDIIWIFFSGYGVCLNGQDYLVPIDGNPQQAPTTAIAIESLMAALRSAPTKNIILALDINRSQAVLEGQRVGVQVATLAERYGISTILSCQLDQFAHETLALRHGFFTAVLLEGLRYEKCVTLNALVQYLSQRLPELAEHHWRPPQTPQAIVPSDQRYELILPKEAALTGVYHQAEPSLPALYPPIAPDPPANGQHEPLPARPLPPTPNPAAVPYPSSTNPSTDPSIDPQSSPTAHAPDPFWRQFWIWGSVFVVALLAGVVLFNRDALLMPAEETGGTDILVGEEGAPDSPTPETVNRAMLDEAIASLLEVRAASPVNQATDFRRAINLAQRIPEGEPFYAEAQDYTQRWSRIIFDFALARAAQGNYRAAIATSQLVPANQAEVQALIDDRLAEWQQGAANQELLDQAKALTRSQQASSYNEAIGIARRIPPGQPLHDQAQTLISQWGQDIFTVARARAAQNNFQAAMDAARLVPPGTPAYEDAQAAIAQWQQRL